MEETNADVFNHLNIKHILILFVKSDPLATKYGNSSKIKYQLSLI